MSMKMRVALPDPMQNFLLISTFLTFLSLTIPELLNIKRKYQFSVSFREIHEPGRHTQILKIALIIFQNSAQFC